MNPADRQRYVIHLPVVAAGLDSAKRFARTLARSVTFLPEVDGGDATVSEEDNQGVRHRVFCDRLLDGGRRCALRADHPTSCAPLPALTQDSLITKDLACPDWPNSS